MEGVSKSTVVQINGAQKPQAQSPNLKLPGYQYLHPGFQGYSYGYYAYPQWQYQQVQPSGTVTVETTKSNGGLFGMMEKFTGLKVGDKGVVPLFLDTMGLKHKKKEVQKVHYTG